MLILEVMSDGCCAVWGCAPSLVDLYTDGHRVRALQMSQMVLHHAASDTELRQIT